MEKALSLNNTQQIITLNDIIPAVQNFEPDKVYNLPTPYNTFGAGEIIMNTLIISASGRNL